MMEKALHLWVEIMNEYHVPTDGNVLHQKVLSLYEDIRKGSPETSDHITFIILYRQNCSILFSVIVVNLLLHLIYKLNFSICMYRKKHSIYRVPYYPWFQPSTGGLGTYPSWIKGDHCIQMTILCVDKGRRNRIPHIQMVDVKIGTMLWKIILQHLTKLIMHILFAPDIYPRETLAPGPMETSYRNVHCDTVQYSNNLKQPSV